MNRIRSLLVRGVVAAVAAGAGQILLAEDQPAAEARAIEVQADGIEVQVEVQAVEGVLKQAVEGGVRILLGVPAVAPLAPAVPGGDAAAQQLKQQQLQQAKQMEQMLQPVLHAELEFIRTTCGDLGPEAKRAIKTAAADAVREAARQFAVQQHRPGRRSLDLSRVFAEKLDPIVEQQVSSDAVAVWRRERDARRERRAEAARLLIAAKLDETLELTAAQREAILADLRARWDDAWLCELQDSGRLIVNDHRPAPDYAAATITPHLDERQRQAWDAWVKAAGRRQAAEHLGWRFPDGPGLRGADPWWDK
ncbi:MAG: hypothetical protein RLZZ21_2644 [Planctomycetota bacterium]|jgi:hypothetical protein